METKRPEIAIVGAGMAGLSAALTLHDAGIACAIYESSARVGGRVHSDTTTWGAGLASEWCGEFIDPEDTSLLNLINRFGLPTLDLSQGVAADAANIIYLNQRFIPADEQARDFAAIMPLIHQQYDAVGFPTTYDHFTAEGQRLDHMSVYDWIEQYVPGGHDSPLGRRLDFTCLGVDGLETHQQSALNLIYLFGPRAQSYSPSAARPLQGQSKILGGNAQLPLAMARVLPAESLHLGHRLLAVAQSPEGGVRLTFATDAGTIDATYPQVILTLPFTTLRQVNYEHAGFDPRKRQAIEQLGYGTTTKLFMLFDQPYWQTNGAWPHPNTGFFITDLDVMAVWDAAPGQTTGPHILVDYVSGPRGAAFQAPRPYMTTTEDGAAALDGYVQRCLQQLEQLFPGISPHYLGKASLSYPTGDPNLRGSYSCWGVGQYTAFAGYEKAPQGAIHFAGEHCSVDYQGYIEGAVREGIRAAQEIMAAS